ADYVDASNFFGPLLDGRRITALQNNNLGVFDDPEVNAGIDRAMASADTAQRNLIWHQLDSLVMEKAPIAPTIHSLETRLFSPRTGGCYHHIPRLMKIDRLYLKQVPASPPVASRAR